MSNTHEVFEVNIPVTTEIKVRVIARSGIEAVQMAENMYGRKEIDLKGCAIDPMYDWWVTGCQVDE